jgi:S-disulfanyl-L-cysteine oxidoreductase SoxD
MFTITNKVSIAGALLAMHAGLACGQGYNAPYNFGTAPRATELSEFFAIPADGRGLPPGRGTYDQGRKVYLSKCVACHGEKLEGVKGAGDTLIGGRGSLASGNAVKTVESYWPYSTTLFDYVKRAMPFDAPGSMTDDDVYAVTAYILGEAKIIERSEVVDAKTLPRIQMPNRDGFVGDPRPDVHK